MASEIPPQGFDAFLQVDGIEGEGAATGLEKWIEILSFSWGVSQTANVLSRSGAAAGKANVRDFTFTKELDKASPKLMQACATGQHIKKAVLTCRKAGGDQQDFLKITFSTILVSSFVEGGHTQTGDEPTPAEEISFNFSKIEVVYTPQKSDGQGDQPVIGGAAVDSGN